MSAVELLWRVVFAASLALNAVLVVSLLGWRRVLRSTDAAGGLRATGLRVPGLANRAVVFDAEGRIKDVI